MYEVYYYIPTDYRSHAYYNIRNTVNNKTTGCRMSLSDTLTSRWEDNFDILSTKLFEHRYGCQLLFSVDSLDDILEHYPEYFI